jgi:hypothetical protein
MNIADVKYKFSQGDRLDYLFFWSHRSNPDGSISKTCLSQWFNTGFEIDGIHYQTAEHYMMAEKARLFEDPIVLTEILEGNLSPSIHLINHSSRWYVAIEKIETSAAKNPTFWKSRVFVPSRYNTP